MTVADDARERWPLSVAPASQIQAWLKSLGYELMARTQGFSECLVSRGDERWLGRGLSEEEALADALRQMCPSNLARKLFCLLGEPIEAKPKEVSAKNASDDVKASSTEVTGPANAETPPVATRPMQASSPEHGVAPGEALVAREVEPESPLDTQRLKRFPAPPPVPLKAPSPESLEALKALEELLETRTPDIFVAASPLVRTTLISFVTRARAIADKGLLGDTEYTRNIASTLGKLAKRLWPGQLRCLQLMSTPLAAGADLGLPDGGKLHDWEEAADKAEEAIEALRAKHEADGLDEFGWADSGACHPAPTEPSTRLDRIRQSMVELFGSFLELPSDAVRTGLQTRPAEYQPKLEQWAKELRWLRVHVDSPVLWGEAFGRLRWAVATMPQDFRRLLEDLLDESYRPTQTWPAELGQNPLKSQYKKRKKELMRSRPTGPEATREKVVPWLAEAFELTEVLPISVLAQRVSDWADLIGSLRDDEQLRDRRFRRRLKDLQDALGARSSEDSSPVESVDTDVDVVHTDSAVLDVDEGRVDYERLLQEVKEKTDGKRALFVSNRADPGLKEQLQTGLGLEVTWVEINPRRIDAKVESVRQGTFDLVLSATGFQGHRVDVDLGRATRTAGRHYIRVNRGRFKTCVLAIGREFGLRAA
jgi:hypothetical protein